MKKNLFSALMFLLSAFVLVGCQNPKDPNPEPTPNPDPTYDYNVKATHNIGEYYYNTSDSERANYYLLLSEMTIDVSQGGMIFDAPGLIISLDLYAAANEKMLIPDGKYSLTDSPDKIKDMTLFNANTKVFVVSDKLSPDTVLEFTEATAEVSHDGEQTIIVFNGKTTEGKTVHCTYKGVIAITDKSGGGSQEEIDKFFPPLQDNLNPTIISSELIYKSLTDKEVGIFSLRLYDYTPDTFGTTVIIDFFAQVADGEVKAPQPGKFTVGEVSTTAAGTIAPGWIKAETMQNIGTCSVTKTVTGEQLKQFYGLVNAGTLDIAVATDGTYTFTVDFTTNKGKTIKCTFTGVPKLIDESYFSTLEEDVYPNLTGAPCTAEFYGQLFLANHGFDGNVWMVTIGPGEGIDQAMQINLVAPVNTKFEDGLPCGEYKITQKYQSGDFICIPGEMDNGGLFCSWYMSKFDSDGMPTNIAPFFGGTVYVDPNPKGSGYWISTEAYDDVPRSHAISGQWTGEITKYIDRTKTPAQGVPAMLRPLNKAKHEVSAYASTSASLRRAMIRK